MSRTVDSYKRFDVRVKEMINNIVLDVMEVTHDSGGPIGHWCCEEDVRKAVERNVKDLISF